MVERYGHGTKRFPFLYSEIVVYGDVPGRICLSHNYSVYNYNQ